MVIKIVFFMTIICSTGAKFVGNNVFVPFCQFFAFTPVNLVVQSFFHLESVSKQQSLYQLSYYCPNPLSQQRELHQWKILGCFCSSAVPVKMVASLKSTVLVIITVI